MTDQTITDTTATITMEQIMEDSPFLVIPELGSLVEGEVVSINRNKILVDLGGVSTGIISGRETRDSADTMKSLAVGDKISACVVEIEDVDGLVVLSLRKASQEKTWKKFIKAFEVGDIIEVKPNEANKGGLLLEIDGIKGFIPVSQLAPLHYPRVNGADSTKILGRLEKLIGEKFHVKIINIDKENNKLILSEKEAYTKEREDSLKKLKPGQKVQGHISGVVNFGIFVAFEGLEGLVHISEIAWGHVKNPADFGKLGDPVEILVIGIEGEKISLSMKRLVPDPWIEAAKTYAVGKIVEGEITRITQFGAFMKLNNEINGLIHLSEITEEPTDDANKVLKMGDKVKAKIITVDLDEHRIGLSIKALTEKPKKEKKEEGKEEEKSEGKEEKKSKKEEKQDETFGDLKLTAKVKKALEVGGYKNLEELKKASLEDLTNMEGIGEKTARKIVDQLK